MQVPSTLDGLRAALQSLGYGAMTTGLENMDLDTAKQAMRDQLDYAFDESDQTLQDRHRYRRARSMVERFTPAVSASATLASVVKAIRQLRALLRHDIPAPEGASLDVVEFEVEETDDEGIPTSVRITQDDSCVSCDDRSCDDRSCSGDDDGCCSDCSCQD